MSKFGIGQPVRRIEDQRLITGQGRYTDDINLPGQAMATCCARRPPTRRIVSLDTAPPRRRPACCWC